MEFSKEAIHRRCVEALSEVGLPPVVCQYYADAAQCEYDVTNAIYRMHSELQQASLQPRDVATIVNITRIMSQNFSAWKETLDELISRRSSVPSLSLDQRKISNIQRIKALCTLQTKEMQLTEGDDVIITDASQPNKLKVRNERGEEGYVPTLSCFLPSPDRGSLDVVDRLQLYLLMCWADFDKRLKSCLNSSLILSANDLLTFWSHRAASSDKWEERVSRRLQRIADALSRDLNVNGLEYGRLHRTLANVENELLSRKDADLESMITNVVNVDKAVLTYQAFKKQWRLFRQEVRESSVRPMQLVLQWDPDLLADQHKKCRYYEVKLTSEKTTVQEETVQVNTEDERRRKDAEQRSRDILTVDTSLTRDTHRQPPDIRRDDLEEQQRSLVQTTVVTTTTETESSRDTNVRDTEPDKEWSDSGWEEWGQRNIITTTETSTESWREKNLREESGPDWSKRIRDEADSALHDHGSTTEESWASGSTRLDMSKLLRIDERLGLRSPSPASPLSPASALHRSLSRSVSSQAVDSEQLNISSHEEKRRFYIRAIVDPRNGLHLSVKEALSNGIINRSSGEYVNPKTGEAVAIETAMNDGRIMVDHVTTTRTPEKCQTIGLMTIVTQIDTHEYLITGVMDTRTGRLLSTDEAREVGCLNEEAGTFISTATGEQMSLDDAAERGFVQASFDDAAGIAAFEPTYDMKTYAIGFVVDQLMRRPVPFTEAIRRGLVDLKTGCYINNVTSEHVFAADALRRGFFKGEVVDDPTALVGIDSSNRVVVERIQHVRKNVIR